MKISRLFLGLALALSSACAAAAADHLWQDFDSSATGSVAALPGWTRAAWLGTQTAQVSLAHAYSQPQCLELAPHAAGSSAVYTNFSSTYTTNEHPVIRCSASLYLASTSTPFQIGLRNSAAGHFLKFMNTNGFGQFGFQYHDVHFATLVTGTFVDVTFFYNRSNNTYRLDYFFTNRVPWALADSDPATHTQFNQFVAYRPASPGDTGDLFLDDLSVQTFPPHVWAWWRCDPTPSQEFVEQLGVFHRGSRIYTYDIGLPGSSEPIWDGIADFHNQGACRLLIAPPAPCLLATPSSTNWTVEAAFRLPTNASNTAFLDWGTAQGFDATGAWLGFGYLPVQTSLYLNVRDAQQADSDFHYLALGPFRPTGRWQHVALVKSNATATLYVDYQFVTSQVLAATADGAYAFAPPSHASLGQTLNQGNPSDIDTLIDEVRVSGKALAPAEFLQPGQPLIVDIVNHPTNATWKLTLKGILGKSYRVETSPALGPAAAWQFATNLVADYTFNYVNVPGTAPKTNFVRVIREN